MKERGAWIFSPLPCADKCRRHPAGWLLFVRDRKEKDKKRTGTETGKRKRRGREKEN
jgi:hypothetical protein